MSRNFFLTVLVLFALVLVGCGGGTSSTSALPTGNNAGGTGDSAGSFTEAIPIGAYSPESGGAHVMGDAMVQLSDGSVLTAGGDLVVQPGAANYINTAATLSVDGSGALTLTQAGNMGSVRFRAGGARLPDGRVLIAGGDAFVSASPATATAEIYNPQTKSFAPTGSMTTPRADLWAMLPLANGTILLLGGDFTSGPATGEVYDPASGTFGSQFSLAQAAPGGGIAVLHDGRILFAGGVVSCSTAPGCIATDDAELFDRQSRTFTPAGKMTVARASTTATTLADGTVLVAGGIGNTGSTGLANGRVTLASAEIYDPAKGTFTATGSMAEPLGPVSSILLASGKVLVAGGNSLTAELYDPATRQFTKTGPMKSQLAPVGTALSIRMFPMPNGTIMLTDSPSDPFEFYHP